VLLLVNEDVELSPAEQRFAEWIQWSPAQRGVALLNVDVPAKGRPRQLDAVIWTQQRCIVIEVKGFRTRQDGTLVVPPNGPWLMSDGQVADIYGNGYDHNPIKQVRTNTLAMKNWASQVTHRGCFVYGLVLVMLLPGQDVPALDTHAHPRENRHHHRGLRRLPVLPAPPQRTQSAVDRRPGRHPDPTPRTGTPLRRQPRRDRRSTRRTEPQPRLSSIGSRALGGTGPSGPCRPSPPAAPTSTRKARRVSTGRTTRSANRSMQTLIHLISRDFESSTRVFPLSNQPLTAPHH
jgi:hypothetical protein